MAEFPSFVGELYKSMGKRKLFTEEEIKRIKETREKMHNKISKPSRTINDFAEYIKYEYNLLKLIEKREPCVTTSKLQTTMSNSIKNLYNKGLGYYPNELKFWNKYIEFLENYKFHNEISTCYEKMLKNHGHEPYIWIEAALFDYGKGKDIDHVKDIFYRGLQRHPTDINIHLEFFKLMLNETNKMSNELNLPNTSKEQTFGLKKIEIIYKNSKRNITDIEYYIEALATAENYSFTENLQIMISSDMIAQFPLSEKMWHIFAQRELKGYSLNDLAENEILIENNTESNKNCERMNLILSSPSKFKKRTLRQKIQLCTAVYNSATKELKTEKIWNYYLSAMLELYENQSRLQQYRREKLQEALKAAHEANFMSEYFYDIYIDLLKENENENSDHLIKVMNIAVERYPNSIKLWQHLLIFYIAKDEITAIEDTFNKAKEKLQSFSGKLYKILIPYYHSRLDCFDKLDETYNDACKETTEDFLKFRVDYLEYTAIIKEDIELTRVLYDKLSLLLPPDLDLHETMAYFESIQTKPDEARWRLCYENSINLLGKSNIKIWLKYLKFEREHGDPKNFPILYERAKTALDQHLFEHFETDYKLFISY